MQEMVKGWISVIGGQAISDVLSAVITLVIGILLIRLLMALVRRALGKSKLEKAAHSLVISMIQIVMYLLLALIVASALGIDITGVVALASVLTLAVSLALQNMLGNVIGGFTLLTTRPFHSGDFVEVAGQSGTVQEINMTYTRLATPDNKLVSIPNSAVVASQIVNYSEAGTRRVDINVSASYDTPITKVIDALLQAGTVDKALLEPAPFAAVMHYGESTIDYTLRVWVKSEDYWDVFFELNQRVKANFDEEGVVMSYPHLNVHLN